MHLHVITSEQAEHNSSMCDCLRHPYHRSGAYHALHAGGALGALHLLFIAGYAHSASHCSNYCRLLHLCAITCRLFAGRLVSSTKYPTWSCCTHCAQSKHTSELWSAQGVICWGRLFYSRWFNPWSCVLQAS